jgi:hypothetical protein
MTADIHAAARQHVDGQVSDYARDWFADGAVWAAARVTPTREQIEDVLRKSGAWCGDCNFEMDHCSGCKHVREVYAESVLRLIQELAEGEK